MTYDSPTQLRRRQQAAENKAPRKRRQQAIKISSEAEWAGKCDFHIEQIHANSDWADMAGTHARALVHMAIQRRAYQIMADYGRAYWKAMEMAKHELLNGEVA